MTSTTVAAHFYCGLMVEAVHAVVSSHDLNQQALRFDHEGSSAAYEYCAQAGMMARYGFLTGCIAVESAANAILEGTPGICKSLYADLEKLSTLNKFDVFALVQGKPLDRGCDTYAKMKDVWKLRNDFFHPKERLLHLSSEPPYSILERASGTRNYPNALDVLEPAHAIALIGDMLRFLAWVVFDTCGMSLQDGARLLSRGMVLVTAPLVMTAKTFSYDLRSLGSCGEIEVIPFKKSE